MGQGNSGQFFDFPGEVGLVGVAGLGGGDGQGRAGAGQGQGLLHAQDAGEGFGAVAEGLQGHAVQAAGAQTEGVGEIGNAGARAEFGHYANHGGGHGICAGRAPSGYRFQTCRGSARGGEEVDGMAMQGGTPDGSHIHSRIAEFGRGDRQQCRSRAGEESDAGHLRVATEARVMCASVGACHHESTVDPQQIHTAVWQDRSGRVGRDVTRPNYRARNAGGAFPIILRHIHIRGIR